MTQALLRSKEIKGCTTFLLLMCAQAAHSAEEYVFRLYEVFAPARARTPTGADGA